MARVKIYTTDYCGYCHAAKSLLTRRGLEFEEIDASSSISLREWLTETTGQRTVPQIFFDEVPIGGYRELSALDREGRLTSFARSPTDPGTLA